jgi:hypothetical protein
LLASRVEQPESSPTRAPMAHCEFVQAGTTFSPWQVAGVVHVDGLPYSAVEQLSAVAQQSPEAQQKPF